MRYLNIPFFQTVQRWNADQPSWQQAQKEWNMSSFAVTDWQMVEYSASSHSPYPHLAELSHYLRFSVEFVRN